MTRSFIYADDLCVRAQYSSFTEVEKTIGDALDKLTQYYRSNSLRANPDKIQVTAEEQRGKTIIKSLFYFIVSQNIDILALTETWLCCGDNAVLNELLPPDCDIRHVDRERRGGGVALIYI